MGGIFDSIIGGGNSHKSNIADLGEKFDPSSWMAKAAFGKNTFMNPHKFLKPATRVLNEGISTVTKPVNKFMTSITPGKQYLDDHIPILKQWNKTVENRPVDAAGIAAATFFTGGALAGAGAGGAGAAGATSAGSLAAPAASSIGGIGGMSAGMGASAITPAFASGVGAAGASGAGAIGGGSLLGAAGTGTLGAAGTATMASSSILPTAGSFAGMGGAGVGATEGMSATDKINMIKQGMESGKRDSSGQPVQGDYTVDIGNLKKYDDAQDTIPVWNGENWVYS